MSPGHQLYAEAYQQLASVSAVLGGLAFTAAAALLASAAGTENPKALGRPAKVTVATAVTGAVCLVLAALMWSLMAADVLRAVAQADIPAANRAALLNRVPSVLLLGESALFFASVGASGWIASHRLGWLTTAAAVVGGGALLLFLRWFGS